MNSNKIKLSGSFEIPEPVQIDRDYELTLTGGITSIAKTSNEDGTFTYSYTLKPLYGEIIDDKGETVKVVRKGSQSQKMRAMILNLGYDYEPTMSKLMDNLETILKDLRE